MMSAGQDIRTLPIGIFDSGVGGLTVLRQVQERLPSENLIYFGDTARVPYGSKSKGAIIRYSIENAIFLIEQEIKLLVVACNTASAFALSKLQSICKVPVLGVIEPGVEKAVQSTRNSRIAVLGTKGTIDSNVYTNEIRARLPGAHVVSKACPLFVPLVEEKFVSHPAAHLIVREYLAPLHREQVDTVLLGCTHYPVLKDLIKNEMEEGAAVVDSAVCCSEKIADLLEHLQLQNQQAVKGTRKFFVSDDPDRFAMLAEEFLGRPIPSVEQAFSFHLH